MNESEHSKTGSCEGLGSDSAGPGLPYHKQTPLSLPMPLPCQAWSKKEKKNSANPQPALDDKSEMHIKTFSIGIFFFNYGG